MRPVVTDTVRSTRLCKVRFGVRQKLATFCDTEPWSLSHLRSRPMPSEISAWLGRLIRRQPESARVRRQSRLRDRAIETRIQDVDFGADADRSKEPRDVA